MPLLILSRQCVTVNLPLCHALFDIASLCLSHLPHSPLLPSCLPPSLQNVEHHLIELERRLGEFDLLRDQLGHLEHLDSLNEARDAVRRHVEAKQQIDKTDLDITCDAVSHTIAKMQPCDNTDFQGVMDSYSVHVYQFIIYIYIYLALYPHLSLQQLARPAWYSDTYLSSNTNSSLHFFFISHKSHTTCCV